MTSVRNSAYNDNSANSANAGDSQPVESDNVELNPIFARPGEATHLPRHRLPEGESLPDTAYQIVHDEAMLDGNARLNLATFVGTWMDDYANRLYAEAADKNMIDKDEYPATAEIENRCWHMLADLWNAPNPENSIGTSTIGSSEACMLGGLALKRRWQHQRKAAGKSTERPNLVLSSAVQVCWEKFCNYFDVEPRYVPITEEHKVLDGFELENYVDENTIGVVAILGVTYTGMFEPVAQIAKKLDEIEKEKGLDLRIHVDAASGGMIAPFLQPELEWDFRLPRVASINVSGHKYGLVYPGLGWVVWRERTDLPDDLIFEVSYLGGTMPTFALNFSRPGAQVLLQYYLFLRLGFDGYRRVQESTIDVARYIAGEVAKIPELELWNAAEDIPVFAWRLRPDSERTWNLYDLSDRLRMKGWLIPAYPMPDHLQHITVQRIVVRNGLSHDLASFLVADIRSCIEHLNKFGGSLSADSSRVGFHH
ncbi:glutamate decarboxylase [Corynebacterium flavescens]|uniref:glutamate decarboxylase n=1 Tax=Corynebacterium flavescens TaxID=28028 RepID=UPI003FD5555B